MVLRYFYFNKYNNIVQDLDVNLGGQYKFYYKKYEKKLYIVKDNKYVRNLYREYNVISDVSAILGKNSSGKTTVLRMINSIFNGCTIWNKEKYIIIFETKYSYILYTNYEYFKYEEAVLNKKLRIISQKFLDSINVLKNVGLIYFSNIFDKATPFEGNANLIDISTNYAFEKFCEEKIKNKIKKIDEKSHILDEYKASCILQEIAFLTDIGEQNNKDEINLLFKVPNRIKIGFIQIIQNNEDDCFCDDIEVKELLLEIYRIMVSFFSEKETKNKLIFQNEILFYFVFDFLYQLSEENYHNVLPALGYWKDKIAQKDWELFNYYEIILDKLQSNYVIQKDIKDTFSENIEIHEINYKDILDDFDWIQNALYELQNIEVNVMLKKIAQIENFVIMKKWRNQEEISFYLEEATYFLKELQSDLLYHDYDLYNLSYIDDAINLIENAYSLFSNELDDEYVIVEYDEADDEKIEIGIDADIQDKLIFFKAIIDMFIDFVKKYDFDSYNNMLEVKLDNEDIFTFIDNFQELNCQTIELEVKRNDINSGHSAYLDMCARINMAGKSGEIQKKDNIILLIDEGDIYLHPEKQLRYLNNLFRLLQILYENKKVQVIITSNSPFIISDIQTSNILYLENRNGKINITKSSVSNTFASNINNLLLDSFFIKDSLIGEFAFQKINNILQILLKDEIAESEYNYIKDILKIIGEPIIRKKLECMLFDKQGSNLEQEVRYYEEKLAYIKRIRDKKDNG